MQCVEADGCVLFGKVGDQSCHTACILSGEVVVAGGADRSGCCCLCIVSTLR